MMWLFSLSLCQSVISRLSRVPQSVMCQVSQQYIFDYLLPTLLGVLYDAACHKVGGLNKKFGCRTV